VTAALAETRLAAAAALDCGMDMRLWLTRAAAAMALLTGRADQVR